MDVIQDLGNPLPAIVNAEILEVPTEDHKHLTAWSMDFAETIGNFLHDRYYTQRALKSTEMSTYFRATIRRQQAQPQEGLINVFLTSEIDGDRLSEEEIYTILTSLPTLERIGRPSSPLR